MRESWLSIAVMILTIGGIAGCGGTERPPTHPVSGTITMDSKPVADAMVGFHPVTVGSPPAMGKTDADGNYQLTTFNTNDGAIAAQYTITISKQEADGMPEEIDLDDPGDAYGEMMESEASTSGEQLLPAVYASPETSPEKRTVVEGSNEFSFDLAP